MLFHKQCVHLCQPVPGGEPAAGARGAVCGPGGVAPRPGVVGPQGELLRDEPEEAGRPRVRPGVTILKFILN